jgi:hypothetical protein
MQPVRKNMMAESEPNTKVQRKRAIERVDEYKKR